MFGSLVRSWHSAAIGMAIGGAVLIAAFGAPTDASAKAIYESPYTFERTWNAALRLVRVDMDLKVTEKDVDSGFFLFEYRSPESGNKPVPGTFEMVRGRDVDSPVRVIVQVPKMPQYHEQVMIDALAQKMRSEYGEPPKRKPPAPAQPDAGAPDAPAQPPPQPQPQPPQ